ncbi:unnamed protein product, partial [Mesorhabditis spiculigera]
MGCGLSQSRTPSPPPIPLPAQAPQLAPDEVAPMFPDSSETQLALRVSLEEQRERARQDTAATGNNDSPQGPDVMEMDWETMSEDQQLEWALRMEQEGGQADAAQDHTMDTTAPQGSNDDDDLMNNPELLQQLVNDLPSDASKPDNNKKEKKAEDGPSK